MDSDEHDHMLERLLQVSEQLTLLLRAHQTHLVRIDTAIERLTTVVGDIKTLLARNLPLSENDRDS